MVSFTYCITNLINGKRYVGKSIDPVDRWHGHLKDSRGKARSYIARAIRKHGAENFILQIISGFKTENEAYVAEQQTIQTWNLTNSALGYNLSGGGRGTFRPSTETLQKLRISHQRRIDPSHPDAQPKRCSQCNDEFQVRHPLTSSRLTAHIKKHFCSRKCGTIWHNIRQTGIARSNSIKQRISTTMSGVERPAMQRRLDPSHPDAQPKQCEQCHNEFLPHLPLTLCRLKSHQVKRFCTRKCAIDHHNQIQILFSHSLHHS